MPTEMQLFTVASLLRRGRALDRFSSALTLGALLIGLAPLLGAPAELLTTVFCALMVMLGLGQKYWALRVAVDAELFQQLAGYIDQLTTQTRDLDHALSQLKLQQPNRPARNWEDRSRGALRLLRMQALYLLAQLLLAVLTILGLPWLLITG